MRKSWLIIWLVLALGVVAIISQRQPTVPIETPSTVIVEETVPEEEPPIPTLYGINVNKKVVIEDMVRPNDNLSSILSNYEVPLKEIDLLARKAEGVFDVRKINAFKNYKLICSEDSVAEVLIYEPNQIEYVIFNLEDSTEVYLGQKETSTVEKSITGTITSSLYHSMLDKGATPQLVDLVADVYGWQVDFGHLQPGDSYKIIFKEQLVEGRSVSLGPILAAEFIHENNPFYAVRYDQGAGPDYFDERGNSLRKAFLRYPVKFTRISSRFSGRRFHPVLKRYRSHLGTDYAAPRGTPIRAAGDGVISEARYKRGNGNYVKIRHNGTFSTQYLHMSRIAKGIRPGAKVAQGQTIGYVGSTGLANGPHLCYRFWKNGVQVDAMKVEIPPSEPIAATHHPQYDSVMIQMLDQLQKIPATGESNKILAGE